jgi:hypothetical protein
MDEWMDEKDGIESYESIDLWRYDILILMILRYQIEVISDRGDRAAKSDGDSLIFRSYYSSDR